jgi:hypothetical protein
VKIELLYFDGCPTYKQAQQGLSRALLEKGIESQIRLRAVTTNEEAQRTQFPGSPTMRVDGRDLFPATENQAWGLGCRMYATPEGLRGTPTKALLREALLRQYRTI